MLVVSPEKWAVITVMRDGNVYTAGQVAGRLGKSVNATTRLLLKLAQSGITEKAGWGAYRLTTPLPDVTALSPEPPQKPGIYVVRCGDLYKIGRSTNIDARIRTLRQAIPQETVHACTLLSETPAKLEAELHQRYADKRVRGEWFKLDVVDVDELLDMADSLYRWAE